MVRWLRNQLGQYSKHFTSLLDEPVTERRILSAVALRNLGFLLNPIIAGALLGRSITRVYLAIPSEEQFHKHGYKFNPIAIVDEARALFFSGRVAIWKQDVSRGGANLSFHQFLQRDLWKSFSDSTRLSIRGYVSDRATKEGLALGTAPTAGPSAEQSTEQLALGDACVLSVPSPGEATIAGSSTRRRRDNMAMVHLAVENAVLKEHLARAKRQRLDSDGRAARCEARLQEALQALAGP